jgi:hypothetical protein
MTVTRDKQAGRHGRGVDAINECGELGGVKVSRLAFGGLGF